MKPFLRYIFLTLVLTLIFLVNASVFSAEEVVNLSVGKPYTTVGVVNKSFPDTNKKELTDGIFGTKSYLADSAWVGVSHRETESGMVYDEWPLYTTVIDLQKECTVTEVSANFVRNYDLRVGFPTSVKVYASLDNIYWEKLCSTDLIFDHIPDGVYKFGWNVPDVESNITKSYKNKPAKARYIRYDFVTRSDMHLFDEITVMGYEDPEHGGDPRNLRKLENGTIKRGGGEPTGWVTDMVLINFNPEKHWTKESLTPYLAYVDKDGNIKDTLFDTVCFVANTGPNGRVYDVENSLVTADDWKWYLDYMFEGENSYLNILNELASEISHELDKQSYRAKVVLMMPFPPKSAVNFGSLNGRNLDLSKEEDWKFAVDWYVDEVFNRIVGGREEGLYNYLDFPGLYWINEYPNEAERIIYANEYINNKGMKSYWIPYFHSAGYLSNERLDFSAIALQPNHFFSDSYGNTLGAGGTKIIETVAKLGAYANMGVEMEFDLRLDTDKDAYNRFLDYLNTAANMGYQGPGYYRNWYEAGGGILGLANSRAPELRTLYDNVYEVIKGNYKPREYIYGLNENLLSGKKYTHNATKWYAGRSDDTKCIYLTDNVVNGTFYGSAYFGVENEDATITFDLETPVSLEEIHIVAFKDKSAGVNLPKTVKISAKSQGEWKTVYDGAYPDSLRAVFSSDTDIKASALKFEFTRNGGYIFLKEIMAYADKTAVKHDAKLITDTWLLGDVTGDGVVNNTDVIQINRKIVNLSSVFDAQENREVRLKVADVTGEGVINNSDVIQINRKNANMSSVFDRL